MPRPTEPITITLVDLKAENQKNPHARQCADIHMSRGGSGVFCLRPSGHEGSHRGDRRQWPNAEDAAKAKILASGTYGKTPP